MSTMKKIKNAKAFKLELPTFVLIVCVSTNMEICGPRLKFECLANIFLR